MRGRIAVGVLAAVVGIGVAVPVTLAVSGATKPRTSTTALAQWLLAPNAREVTLRGTRNASLAKAVMTDSGVYLVADGLAVNDRADSTYVLWASNSSAERVPMATFDVRNGSPVQLVVTKLPFKTSDVTQVAISLEPGRKAPAAPSVVVLSGMAA